MIYQEEVARLCSEGATAADLLERWVPGADKRLQKAGKQLGELIRDVRTWFPEAMLYVEAEGGLCLLLGDSHSDGARNPDLKPQKFMQAAQVPTWVLPIESGAMQELE